MEDVHWVSYSMIWKIERKRDEYVRECERSSGDW